MITLCIIKLLKHWLKLSVARSNFYRPTASEIRVKMAGNASMYIKTRQRITATAPRDTAASTVNKVSGITDTTHARRMLRLSGYPRLYASSSLTNPPKVAAHRSIERENERAREWMFPGGVLIIFLGGVCRPVLKTLNLFQTKIYDFPYPISDLTLKMYTLFKNL